MTYDSPRQRVSDLSAQTTDTLSHIQKTSNLFPNMEEALVWKKKMDMTWIQETWMCQGTVVCMSMCVTVSIYSRASLQLNCYATPLWANMWTHTHASSLQFLCELFIRKSHNHRINICQNIVVYKSCATWCNWLGASFLMGWICGDVAKVLMLKHTSHVRQFKALIMRWSDWPCLWTRLQNII